MEKKIRPLIFIFLCLFTGTGSAQITPLGSVPSGGNNIASAILLHSAGEKLLVINGNNIGLYNTDLSVYQNITIPALGGWLGSVYYVTDNLLDSDTSTIEYVTTHYYTSSQWGGSSSMLQYRDSIVTRVIDETGSILFERQMQIPVTSGLTPNGYPGGFIAPADSASVMWLYGAYALANNIVHDTTAWFYRLPGRLQVPCCCSGDLLYSGLEGNIASGMGAMFQVNPNPFSSEIKLEYRLPEGERLGRITVFDIEGRLIKRFEVSSDFSFVLLKTDELAKGTYLYELSASGGFISGRKAVKVE